MRLLRIPDLEYEDFTKIRWAILKHIPFAVIEIIYESEHKIGYFNFWDVEYIPLQLRKFIVQPPASREPVEKMLAEIERVADDLREREKNGTRAV